MSSISFTEDTSNVSSRFRNVFRQLFERGSRRHSRQGKPGPRCRCRRRKYCDDLPFLSLEQLDVLKHTRDQVCDDLALYTEVLRRAQKNRAANLSEVLNSEVQLLMGGLKLYALETAISDDVDWSQHKTFLKANIKLSKFFFSMKKEPGRFGARKCYVLLLQNDLEFKTSKVVLPEHGLLDFENEYFEFQINNLFEIKCQIYSMKYPAEHPMFPRLTNFNWTLEGPQIDAIFYDDPIRKEPTADLVRKSSFELCGEVRIDLFNHKQTQWKIERPDKSRLEGNGSFVCELVNPDVTSWGGFFADENALSEVIDEL